ncbi:hypothetical protein L3V79_09555 [Thiotrichales bacterium 19S9-12]|nr:hypothetical protein [Thiotrichales bacterium 19S9-11]MCF6812602.1 hypothetical protein [Thiotrichales bacterium 19S9-12]
MRAFIGIPIDKEASNYIYEQALAYQRKNSSDMLRLSKQENYHITLSFLGNISMLQQLCLADQMRMFDDYKIAPFKVKLIAISPFPLGFSKVIAVMVEHNNNLTYLHKKCVI